MLNLDRNTPVVDKDFKPLQKLQMFGEQCAVLEILTGTGSPEGVVPAKMKRLYMESATGQLYAKRVNDIGGNTTTGWVLLSGGGGGGSITDGDYGDIVVSVGGTVWTVDSNVVSNAKLAKMPATTLKGNNTGSSANTADLTVAQVKTLLNYTASDVGAAASSHTHIAADVTDFSEAVDDRVGSLLVAGTNVSLTYNDPANTLTIAAAGANYGTSTVSFGATETNEAQLVVTGQTGILAGAKVVATIGTTATANYTSNDHKYLGSIGVSVTTGAVVAGTSFTIYVRSYQKLKGDISINWIY